MPWGMAKPLRIEFPGAGYHVINRGNYRQHLFKGKGAEAEFVRTLGEAAQQFSWRWLLTAAGGAKTQALLSRVKT